MVRSVGAAIDIDHKAGGFTATSFAVLLALLIAPAGLLLRRMLVGYIETMAAAGDQGGLLKL